jgi:hypothetical protein
MSADNGVYISQWQDGFRVATFTNVSDIEYAPIKTAYGQAVWWNRFKDSPVYKTSIEAYKAAVEIFNSLSVCEYGIEWLEDEDGGRKFPDLDQETANERIENHFQHISSLALKEVDSDQPIPGSVSLGDCIGTRIREFRYPDGRIGTQFDILVQDDGCWSPVTTISTHWLSEMIEQLLVLESNLMKRYQDHPHGFER